MAVLRFYESRPAGAIGTPHPSTPSVRRRHPVPARSPAPLETGPNAAPPAAD